MARRRPASNTVCATDPPTAHSPDGPASQEVNRPLSNPPARFNAMEGKNAEVATPICAFADATRRSAPAISGRLSNKSDGNPGGGVDGILGIGAAAKLKV